MQKNGFNKFLTSPNHRGVFVSVFITIQLFLTLPVGFSADFRSNVSALKTPRGEFGLSINLDPKFSGQNLLIQELKKSNSKLVSTTVSTVKVPQSGTVTIRLQKKLQTFQYFKEKSMEC